MWATKEKVRFHNSIIGHFMAHKVQLETNLFQVFAHPQISECFSVISVIVFEVNIVAEQKQAHC